jgi:hypothetical protein
MNEIFGFAQNSQIPTSKVLESSRKNLVNYSFDIELINFGHFLTKTLANSSDRKQIFY